jgi:putative ABC transport system substrate-binding protein
MPTRFMTKPGDMEMLVNLDVAKKLGLTVPKDLEQNAKIVRQNGKVIKK